MKLYREHKIRCADDSLNCERHGARGMKAAMQLLHARSIQRSWGLTLSVVQGHEISAFRNEPIDLVWTVSVPSGVRLLPLEIKTDLGESCETLVLETVANLERGTPGCFYASRAALFLYYFPRFERIYLFPLEPARSWFEGSGGRFPAQRIMSIGGGERCHARASLVSTEIFTAEVEEVEIYSLLEGVWTRADGREPEPNVLPRSATGGRGRR